MRLVPLLKLVFLFVLTYLPARLALAPALRAFSGMERLGVSLLGSFALFFLAALGSFYSGGPATLIHTGVALLLLGGGLLYGLVSRERRADWPDAHEWRQLVIVILAGAWMLLTQLTVVNYAGGGWSGDWFEHYERALLFDGQRDLDHKFLDLYHLTARPPFFNVLAFFYMRLIGFEFTDYQIIATFLGVSVLIPSGLILRRLLGRAGDDGTQETWILLLVSVLLVLNPMVATNIIYPWTRMLTNTLVIMGIHFYLQGVFDRRDRLLVPAFVLLSGAHLIHYSADVVLAALAGHTLYLLLVRRAVRYRVLVNAAVCSALLSGAWYSWSILRFGLERTLTSNSTWAYLRRLPWGELAQQLGTNFATTLVPFVVEKDPRYVRQMDPSLTLPWLFDHLHLYWVGTLTGAVSTSAILIAFIALAAGIVSRRGVPGDRVMAPRGGDVRFLLLLSVAAFCLGLLIVPNVEQAGISHLVLQPICILILLVIVRFVAGQPAWVSAAFCTAYGAEALLFYFLKTLERVTPTPESLTALYTEIYYENLRLKLVTHQLIFLRDAYPALLQACRAIILGLIPPLCLLAWWILRRRANPARAC